MNGSPFEGEVERDESDICSDVVGDIIFFEQFFPLFEVGMFIIFDS